MKRFYYFLAEQPNYPNQIMANDKREVKSLLMESLADESSIVNILSEEEMYKKSNANTGAIYADAGEYSNGNDFMNAVIKSASNVASQMELVQTKPMKEVNQIEPALPDKVANEIVETPVHETKDEPKFFEEAGIKFKLENGKLYKKVWKDLTSSEDSEFRIISIKTNKPVDSAKFRLEQLDWTEI